MIILPYWLMAWPLNVSKVLQLMSRIVFTTDKRKFIVADTPGMNSIPNMVTGASTARWRSLLLMPVMAF